MMMLTNLEVINTIEQGRRHSDRKEPGNSASQGEPQKQSRTLYEENYRRRALRGRRNSEDSTLPTQYNNVNHTTDRMSSTQLDTEDDIQTRKNLETAHHKETHRSKAEHSARRTTEAEY